MDISYFITWFVNQVVAILSSVFNTLDSITFAGTSLLRVFTTITVLSVLLPVILTIGKSSSVVAHRSDKVKSKSDHKESGASA